MGQNRFDDEAKTWDADSEKTQHIAPVAEAIARLLPQNPNLIALEYGCGTGQLSFALRDRFSKITLMDSSTGMIEVVRRKIAAAQAISMEAIHLDIQETPPEHYGPYDIIYNAMTLHHIVDTHAMLKSWRVLLSNGGRLFIADLDKEDGTFHRSPVTVHHGFEREALGKIASQAGFTNIGFQSVCSLTRKATDGVMRVYPLFLMMADK
jgi:ubiquinone/menaquinone biosynthesis C-methylase UbiE